MTTTAELTTQPGCSPTLRTIPSGRIIQVTVGTAPVLLAEYARILPLAVTDFVRRCGEPNLTPETVLEVLTSAPHDPDMALWLVTTETYRLVGFTLARAEGDVWGRSHVYIVASYFYPRHARRAMGPQMVEAVAAWARAQGCPRLLMTTARPRPRAWQRLGFEPCGTVYQREVS